MSHREPGTLDAVWRYPVKSLLGERLPRADVEARGLVGDRAWAVVTERGKLGSGKHTRRFERVDGLAGLTATWPSGAAPRIRLPSGAEVVAGTPDADRALSEVLTRTVTVAPEGEVRHHDDGAVHLLTRASLAWLEERLPWAGIDERRFRANLIIAGSGTGTVEDDWVGRELRVGDEVVLRVTHRVERCRMTTLAQEDLPHAAEVLRTLAREHDACLGVYAAVVSGGTVAVGDRISWVD